jgi:aldose sugar dehydrogenase
VVFNAQWGELRRETLLTQLHQRVRDVAQGPDGLIYVLIDGPDTAALRLSPAP